MAYEARQRIARLDLHSNASSERGSSSTLASPDGIRRSTSSPTPVPTFYDLDRRGVPGGGVGGIVGEAADDTMRNFRREPASRSSGTSLMSSLSFSQGPYSPRLHQGHSSSSHRSITPSSSSAAAAAAVVAGRTSRSATMSPPLRTGYSRGSPRHYQHHAQHRSTDSPARDYYSGAVSTRPQSVGSMSAALRATPPTVLSRSGSIVPERPLSSSSTSGRVTGTSGVSLDSYANGGAGLGVTGGQDRGSRWGSSSSSSSDHRANGYSAGNGGLGATGGGGAGAGSVRLIHHNSSQRMSTEDVRSSSVTSGSSSPGYSSPSDRYSMHQQQQQQQQQPQPSLHYDQQQQQQQQSTTLPSSSSSLHQRHHSHDDYATRSWRDEYVDHGGYGYGHAQHRSMGYSGEDESRQRSSGYGDHHHRASYQHTYVDQQHQQQQQQQQHEQHHYDSQLPPHPTQHQQQHQQQQQQQH
ncbi:hypothetical protein BGZ98_005436, partial [Dissophora globulifera]